MERRSKRRHKNEKDDKGKRKDDKHVKVIDDDPYEEIWVEKNIDMDGEKASASLSSCSLS